MFSQQVLSNDTRFTMLVESRHIHSDPLKSLLKWRRPSKKEKDTVIY